MVAPLRTFGDLEKPALDGDKPVGQVQTWLAYAYGAVQSIDARREPGALHLHVATCSQCSGGLPDRPGLTSRLADRPRNHGDRVGELRTCLNRIQPQADEERLVSLKGPL
jgi:hypothetical protein